METLNYNELRKEFKRKERAEKRKSKELSYSQNLNTNLVNDNLHNQSRKQEYWQYLLKQKN